MASLCYAALAIHRDGEWRLWIEGGIFEDQHDAGRCVTPPEVAEILTYLELIQFPESALHTFYEGDPDTTRGVLEIEALDRVERFSCVQDFYRLLGRVISDNEAISILSGVLYQRYFGGPNGSDTTSL